TRPQNGTPRWGRGTSACQAYVFEKWTSCMARSSNEPKLVSVEVSPDELEHAEVLQEKVAGKLRLSQEELPLLTVKRRSLDARGQKISFHLLVEVGARAERELGLPHPREVAPRPRVAIVGGGPAGLFCAYELARHGVASLILDRGKMVQPRRRDLKLLNQ